ncbi:hypothetical protein ACFPK1_02430 [Actinomycetospora rhizophila]|uniref:MarR family transcriptional regulator n=1 Tax=Actinomycetospora rhizophila TaxID=1416876 RepID=A0ABV9Z6W3_9PSEU
MLEESPDGLTDAALARQLGDVRPQTVNQLCRRLVAEGALERVGTRPIVNRLPAPTKRRGRRARASESTTAAPKARRTRTVAEPAPLSPEENAEQVEATSPEQAVPAAVAPKVRRPRKARSGASTSADATAVAADPAPDGEASEQHAPKVDVPAVTDEAPAPEAEGPGDAVTPGLSTTDGPSPGEESGTAASSTCGPPPYDALQAWSRVVNVQSLVAGWLVRRGATLRWASVDGTGPARDLIASLDGDDVHVEVTGWPADGARTHPTTIAGDWFSAAEHAAAERRRAHPRARIVIALPDTRRYRSLTAQRATSLEGAGAEVWFVDAAGSVHAR